jgi:zinc-ribbon domain
MAFTSTDIEALRAKHAAREAAKVQEAVVISSESPEAHYCPQCGVVLPDEAKPCINCGYAEGQQQEEKRHSLDNIPPFIADNLLPNEEILYLASGHWIVLVPLFVAAGIFLFSVAPLLRNPGGILPIWAAVLMFGIALGFAHMASTRLALTERRLIGLLSSFTGRKLRDLPLQRIESVMLELPIGVASYGAVRISGTGSTVILCRFLSQPLAFRQKIQEQLAALSR